MNDFVGAIAIAAVMASTPCVAAAGANAADAASFRSRAAVEAGSAVLRFGPEAGAGRYEYLPSQADGRRHTAAVLITPVRRNDYVFFGAQEEAALRDLRGRQALAMAASAAPVRAAVRKSPARSPIAWPKVVVRADGKTVCVPEIAFAEASDWREHLTCTQLAEGMTR
jgi:hypothetical protein